MFEIHQAVIYILFYTMSTRVFEHGKIVKGRYYPPGVKPPTEGTFTEGRYFPPGMSPDYQKFLDTIYKNTKSGLIAVPDLATEGAAEAALTPQKGKGLIEELKPLETVARRIVRGRHRRQGSIPLSVLCKTIRLNDFTSEELNRLLVEIGFQAPANFGAMLRICDLFGNQILTDNEAIAELRRRLPIGAQTQSTKVQRLFTNDQVHGCKATWTDAETGVETVRFLKITTCNWKKELVELVREAVIQAYLAIRFSGKFPKIHRIYDSDYTRRPGTDPKTPHFVFEMEYVEGGSIHDAINKGILDPATGAGAIGTRRPVTLTDLMRILHTVSEMLVEIQGAIGFVHNDLHTGNVCITADGRVVFIDCGHNTFYRDSEAAGVPKVIGGLDPSFYFPAYLCPTIRDTLSASAQGAARNLVRTLWSKTNATLLGNRCYPLDLARQADPDVNAYMRSGDFFYFLYKVLADLDWCRKVSSPVSGADYEGIYQALIDLFQFGRHLNVFEVIRELELTGKYQFIAYFASKDPVVLSAIFPGVPQAMIDIILQRFRPENMRHTVQLNAAVCGIYL